MTAQARTADVVAAALVEARVVAAQAMHTCVGHPDFPEYDEPACGGKPHHEQGNEPGKGGVCWGCEPLTAAALDAALPIVVAALGGDADTATDTAVPGRLQDHSLADLLDSAQRLVAELEAGCPCPDEPHQNGLHDLASDAVRVLQDYLPRATPDADTAVREDEQESIREALAQAVERMAEQFVEVGQRMGIPFGEGQRAKHAGYIEAASCVRHADLREVRAARSTP